MEPPIVLRNSPKIIVTEPTTEDEGFFDATYTFDVPNDYNRLVQQFIKLVVATDQRIYGWNLLKSARLYSEKGNLQVLDDTTLISRFASLYKSGTYFRAIDGFTGTTRDDERTIVVPLFWFFSDKPGDFLDMSRGEKLKLEITTNEEEDMGFPGEVGNSHFQLISCFTDYATTAPPEFGRNKHGYNTFVEDNAGIYDKDESVDIVLRCPHQLCALHFLTRKEGRVGFGLDVTSVTIWNGGKIVYHTERLYNYLLSSGASFPNEEEEDRHELYEIFPMSISFGDRNDPNGSYLVLGNEEDDVYATIKCKPASASILHAVCEYKTDVLQDSSGNYYSVPTVAKGRE
ncbi:hypothetical protein BASA81_002066 [Batrachochytrium salamandrivorans]|nr:hypothetical protein BASA81_002066 [Batrachochytrium salamandrivorans]